MVEIQNAKAVISWFYYHAKNSRRKSNWIKRIFWLSSNFTPQGRIAHVKKSLLVTLLIVVMWVDVEGTFRDFRNHFAMVLVLSRISADRLGIQRCQQTFR